MSVGGLCSARRTSLTRERRMYHLAHHPRSQTMTQRACPGASFAGASGWYVGWRTLQRSTYQPDARAKDVPPCTSPTEPNDDAARLPGCVLRWRVRLVCRLADFAALDVPA